MCSLVMFDQKEILGKDGEAQLITDGVTRDDIKQGILGDCWFLSSCAAVSQRGQLMSKVNFESTLNSQVNASLAAINYF